MIPQLHSFCGKRMTATVTCLFERLGGLKTNIIVSILQQLSKLADRDSSHAALWGQTWGFSRKKLKLDLRFSITFIYQNNKKEHLLLSLRLPKVKSTPKPGVELKRNDF